MIMPPEVASPKPSLKRAFRNPASLGSLALPTALTLFAIIYLGPWYPEMPAASLDVSWKMVLQYAFDHSWQSGIDIIFTYGPLGFISTGLFDPSSYKWMVLAWTLHAILLVATLTALAPRRSTTLLIIASALCIGGGVAFHHDAYLVMAPFMLMVVYTSRPQSKWLIVGWSVLLAVFSLSKFTTMPAALPIIFLITLADVVRFRRVPFSLLSFVMSFFLLYRLSGQRFASLTPFLSNAWDISAGYSRAMQVHGPAIEIVAFAFVALVLLLCAVFVELRLSRGRALWPPAVNIVLALLLSEFLAFKSGFVRHDAHSLLAWGCLVLASTMLALRAKLVLGGSAASTAIIAVGLLSFTFTLVFFHYHLGFLPVQGFSPSYLMTRSVGAARCLFVWNTHLRVLEQQRQASLASIRAQHPIGQVNGTVDLLDVNQAVLIANNLDYRPRPVFQSYSAYTPRLIRHNVEFFESTKRPQNVLVQLVPVDSRLCSLEGGPVWLRLMNGYYLVGRRDEFLLLHERPDPGNLSLSRLAQISAKPGDIVPVPQIDQPLFVRVILRQNLAGKLVSMAFRDPFVYIDARVASGQWRTQRLIPSMASEGFLLSPLIDDIADFAALLARPQHPEHRPDKSPSSIRISMGPRGSRLFDNDMTVEFYRVDLIETSAGRIVKPQSASRP